METEQRSNWIPCGTAVAVGVLIALAAFGGPSEPAAPAPAPTPAAAEDTPRWSGDPSLAGLGVSADAEPGEIEIFY